MIVHIGRILVHYLWKSLRLNMFYLYWWLSTLSFSFSVKISLQAFVEKTLILVLIMGPQFAHLETRDNQSMEIIHVKVFWKLPRAVEKGVFINLDYSASNLRMKPERCEDISWVSLLAKDTSRAILPPRDPHLFLFQISSLLSAPTSAWLVIFLVMDGEYFLHGVASLPCCSLSWCLSEAERSFQT